MDIDRSHTKHFLILSVGLQKMEFIKLTSMFNRLTHCRSRKPSYTKPTSSILTSNCIKNCKPLPISELIKPNLYRNKHSKNLHTLFYKHQCRNDQLCRGNSQHSPQKLAKHHHNLRYLSPGYLQS